MKNILVNIAGKILGPYTSEEVIRGLLEKRFLPIHEILWSGGRWSCISAHPTFAEVCSKISNLNVEYKNIEELTQSLTASFITSTYIGSDNTDTALNSSENTETAANATMDQTKRINVQNLGEEEGTRIFFPTKEELTSSVSLPPRLIPNSTNKKINSSSKKFNTGVNKGSTYVSSADKKEKLAIWQLNKIWWIGLLVFFFAVLIFLWKKQYFEIKDNQQSGLALAEQLLKKNHFQESLKIYKQVITLSEVNHLSLSRNVYENYALLLLLVDQDSFEIKELVDTFLKSSVNKERFLALSHLYSGNPKKALNILNAVTNKTKQDWLNIASAYYLRGLHLKSLKILNQLKTKEAAMLSILVCIKLYKQERDSRWLVRANNIIAIFKNSFYYKQKLSLIKVYIQFLLGKIPQKTDIASILDQDPYLEKNMKVDLFIYSYLWSWSNLNSYCEAIASSSDKLIAKALKIFCLSKGNQKKKNWTLLLESLNRSKTILAGSVLAYVYRQEKLMEKYIVKLAYLTEQLHAKNSLLLLNLALNYCVEKQDKICIQNKVRDLLSVNPKALSALFHRMKLYQDQGLKKEAEKIHTFFKNRAPDYIIF